MKTVFVNDKTYRCKSVAQGNQLGLWEFLYKGRWCPVKNYELRRRADVLLTVHELVLDTPAADA